MPMCSLAESPYSPDSEMPYLITTFSLTCCYLKNYINNGYFLSEWVVNFTRVFHKILAHGG